jgi:hypothetical protein
MRWQTLRRQALGTGGRAQRGGSVIMMAATKEKKNRDLQMLKGMLNDEETAGGLADCARHFI